MDNASLPLQVTVRNYLLQDVMEAREPSLGRALAHISGLGARWMSDESAALLEPISEESRGGWTPSPADVEVSSISWAEDGRGWGTLTRGQEVYQLIDYQDQLDVHTYNQDCLGEALGIPIGAMEDKQCVLLATCAGILWAQTGQPPAMEEVQETAVQARGEQGWQAVEAMHVIGDPDEYISM